MQVISNNDDNVYILIQIYFTYIDGPDLPQIHATGYSVTDMGFSVIEKRNVSLMCQASSNPHSQYVWFYNNSQVYTGPQLTITKIIRMQRGNYTCLAQNTYLNTISQKTVTLTVYCKCYYYTYLLHAFCFLLLYCYTGIYYLLELIRKKI